MKRSLAHLRIAVAVGAVSFLGCDRGPTFDELEAQNKDAIERIVDGAEKVLAAAEAAPPPSKACTSRPDPTKTELLTTFDLMPRERLMRETAPYKGSPGEPPIGRIRRALKSRIAVTLYSASSGDTGAGDQRPDQETLAKMTADYDWMRKVDRVVVLRGGDWGGNAIEALVVTFPDASIECGFTVAGPSKPTTPYDPLTGDAWSSRAGDEDELAMKDWARRVNAELEDRLGLRLPPSALGGDAETISEADTKALAGVRASYRNILKGLVKDAPECAGARATGALVVTTKRLRALAKEPGLGGADVNVFVEPLDLVSKEILEFLRAPVGKRAALAPSVQGREVVVVHLDELRQAVFAKGESFEPGSVRGQAVEFAADGTPRCKRVVKATNPESLAVRSARSTVSYDELAVEANEDLKRQITEKLKP